MNKNLDKETQYYYVFLITKELRNPATTKYSKPLTSAQAALGAQLNEPSAMSGRAQNKRLALQLRSERLTFAAHSLRQRSIRLEYLHFKYDI